MDKKKILICDDEEGIRESLKLILEEHYDLILTKNGNEAINHLKNNNVDLLILDIKMPVINGFDTLREIRKLKPGLKVIIATGYKSVETAKEAQKLGATDYLVKPFNSVEVLQSIEKII